MRLSSRDKKQLVLTLALNLTLPLMATGQTSPATVVELRYSGQALSSGVQGRLKVDLAVKEGFKVAKRPAPKLAVESTPRFEVVAVGPFAESSAGKDVDYFGAFKPLELRIVPAKATEPGKYSLEGKLTYFYCSEREKYCSRSVEALTIPVEVTKR